MKRLILAMIIALAAIFSMLACNCVVEVSGSDGSSNGNNSSVTEDGSNPDKDNSEVNPDLPNQTPDDPPVTNPEPDNPPETPDEFTVTYYKNDAEVYRQVVAKGETAEEYVLQGAPFNVWYCKDEAYDFNLPVTENLQLSGVDNKTFFITFIAREQVVAVCEYGVDGMKDEPEVPTVEGYVGEWEQYDFIGGNFTVTANYTPIVYTVEYVMQTSVIKFECTVEDHDFEVPQTPVIEGYIGVWQYEIDENKVTATAKYEPIIYTIKCFVDGKSIYQFTATIEEAAKKLPKVPEKQHFIGSWENLNFTNEEIVVNAVYLAVNYKIIFIVDGVVYAEVGYTVESESVEEPVLPERKNYIASWENYELSGGNLIVNAVYTFALTPTEGLEYEECEGGLKVIGYIGQDTNIVIPPEYEGKPVVQIGESAFEANETITSVYLPESMTYIGVKAFAYCYSLSEIEIPSSVKVLDEKAFLNCGLERLVFSDGLELIGAMAFYKCDNLKSIVIPETVKLIDEYAFAACSHLTLAEISGSDTVIGETAFFACNDVVIKKNSDKGVTENE